MRAGTTAVRNHGKVLVAAWVLAAASLAPALGQTPPADDPTVLKTIDGSVRLGGRGADGKATTVRVSYDELRRVPEPTDATLRRVEVDLAMFDSASQGRLLTLVNDFGYFAVGLDGKNAKAKQRYALFDAQGIKVGDAESFPIEKKP